MYDYRRTNGLIHGVLDARMDAMLAGWLAFFWQKGKGLGPYPHCDWDMTRGALIAIIFGKCSDTIANWIRYIFHSHALLSLLMLL